MAPHARDGRERLTALTRELSTRILVLDSAMGTEIQALGQRGDFDLLNLTQPDLIRDIHRRYLDAGADIVETNTFTATRIAQADYGTEHLVAAMNLEGARIARAACDEAERRDGRPRWVAGVLGPTNRTA